MSLWQVLVSVLERSDEWFSPSDSDHNHYKFVFLFHRMPCVSMTTLTEMGQITHDPSGVQKYENRADFMKYSLKYRWSGVQYVVL